MNCKKHQWQLLLPKEGSQDYRIDRMLANMSDIVYCPICGKTGHFIKSHRGGIRTHFDNSYAINKANNLFQRHDMPLIELIK